MKNVKIASLLMILPICFTSICTNAQYHQKALSMMEDKIPVKKDVPLLLPDTLNAREIDKVVSDNLDALVNTWYVKNAFKVDSLKSIRYPEMANESTPDSVFIDRLRNLDSFIGLPYNETVKKLIGLYTRKHPGLVSIMMGLSDYYFPLFEEMLSKYNLPLELKYLPVIESALNPKAISRAKATGLWQFMFSTAKLYGLEISSYVDERFDPIKSTEAAVRFLSDLYSIYGDWHVAIAAYNCGPGNVNKAIRRSGGKQNYWEIYSKLPKETRGYIPTFIAATYVMNYAREHNLTATLPSFNLLTDTIELHAYYHFDQIAAILNIPVDELRQLNPQYRFDIIPAKMDKSYLLKLPSNKVSSFIDKQGEIYAFNREKYFPNNELTVPKAPTVLLAADGKKKIIYTVRKGDTPGGIAKSHHITTASLYSWNNIRNKTLQIGQKLAIYIPQKSAPQSKELAAKTTVIRDSVKTKSTAEALAGLEPTSDDSEPINKNITEEYTVYTVRSGDSLYTIAKQFEGVSGAEIIALNQIKNAKGLQPGQKLKIPRKDNN